MFKKWKRFTYVLILLDRKALTLQELAAECERVGIIIDKTHRVDIDRFIDFLREMWALDLIERPKNVYADRFSLEKKGIRVLRTYGTYTRYVLIGGVLRVLPMIGRLFILLLVFKSFFVCFF